MLVYHQAGQDWRSRSAGGVHDRGHERDFPICPGHIAQRAEMAVRMGRDDPGHYSMSGRDENYDGIVVSTWHARDNCAEELITPRRKSSNRVLSPRLEVKTARRVHSWRAVSRLVGASYANHEAQLSQFKQATQFGMRRRPFARTYCLTGLYGVQILSPLSVSVSLVRVSIGELSDGYTYQPIDLWI